MGVEITKVCGQSDENIDGEKRVGTDNRADCKSPSTTDTPRAGGDGRTGGTGGTGGSTETEKADVSGLSVLTEEEKRKYMTANEKEQKRLLRNAKRRERYAKEKADNGQNVKPRKVNAKNKQATTQTFDVTHLNMIVASLSGIVASRPNCEHWLLSEAEINSITQPLSKMLAESDALQTIGQYSNQIALVTACVTVFAPRVVISVQKQKEGKKNAITGQHTDTNVRTIEPKKQNKKSVAKDIGKPATDLTNDGENVSYYGDALC